jgi:hypothetical protein
MTRPALQPGPSLVTIQAGSRGIDSMKTLLSISLGLAAIMLAGCASDSIGDRRSGQLIVCHKENKTLTVSNADSFVHLDHGDTPGPCPNDGEQD